MGSHGSSGSPISCATSTSAFTTDVAALGPAIVPTSGNLTVRLDNRSSAIMRSVDTLISLAVTWSLP